MLGTTDGDFIDPSSEIPAGEMFRLASEYLAGLIRETDNTSNDELLKRNRELSKIIRSVMRQSDLPEHQLEKLQAVAVMLAPEEQAAMSSVVRTATEIDILAHREGITFSGAADRLARSSANTSPMPPHIAWGWDGSAMPCSCERLVDHQPETGLCLVCGMTCTDPSHETVARSSGVADTTKLDPEPWHSHAIPQGDDSGFRSPTRHLNDAIWFDPRPQYEQDPTRYPSTERWNLKRETYRGVEVWR